MPISETKLNISKITGLQAALDAKSPTSHTHAIAIIEGLQAALDAKSPASHTHAIAIIEGLQAALDAKSPTSHTHAIAIIEGLQAALDAKSPTSHTHAIAIIEGLQAALDAKSPTSHTHAIAIIEGLQAALDAKSPILPLAIITSTTEPAVKFSGLHWNEINAPGDLIESWTWINNSWVSQTKEASFCVSGAIASSTYYFPFDSTKNVLIQSYSYFFLTTTTLVNPNYWTVVGTVYSGAAAIVSPPNNLFSLSFKTQTAGQVVIATTVLNKSFVGLNADNLRVSITKTGSPAATNFGFNVSYQYVRK